MSRTLDDILLGVVEKAAAKKKAPVEEALEAAVEPVVETPPESVPPPPPEEVKEEIKEEVKSDDKVSVLKKLVVEKYRLMIAYANYGDQLRAFYRDGIYQHFQEHLAEERAQAYELAKKLTALGEDAPTEFVAIPKPSLDNPHMVFEALRDLELAGVKLYQSLFDLSKDDAALNGLAQNGALQDQQHADDMLRYLRSA